MRAIGAYVRDTRGAAAVEFAIVGAVFVILCMGLIDFGRNFDLQGRVNHAADVAARTLFLDKSVNPAQLATRINAAFPTLGFDRMTVTMSDTSISARPYKRVTLSVPITFLTPGVFRRNGTITVERLVPVG